MEPDFPFPFEPYQIQKQFMTELYSTLQTSSLGIFESPTGTGKSLSMCCSAMKWLKDYEEKTQTDLLSEINVLKLEIKETGETDNWLEQEYEKLQKTQKLNQLQQKLEHILETKKKFEEMKVRVKNTKADLKHTSFKIKDNRTRITEQKDENASKDPDMGEDNEHDYMIDEIEPQPTEDKSDIENESEPNSFAKIYISSRTHSQLSQFVGEIKRTVFAEDTRVVTLASRQHYCINPEVNRLKNVNLINERCLDLQKPQNKKTMADDGKVVKKTKLSSSKGCPYYKVANVTRLSEHVLADVQDMEDILATGRQLKACPYYATRSALKHAQVVLVSHAGIVSAGARSGAGVELQGSVVLVDEAHGLAAALESAHAAILAPPTLPLALTHLRAYRDRYRDRFSSRNLLNINQLVFVIDKLCGMTKMRETKIATEETKIYSLEDFVVEAEIDHLNLRPLIEFCRSTRLAPKLHGFSMRLSSLPPISEVEEVKKSDSKKSLESFLNSIGKNKPDIANPDTGQTPVASNTQVCGSAGSALYAVLNFLEMLCGRSADGRVLVARGEAGNQGGHLKYLLLNAAAHFSQVVEQARSVVLAGGTMEPVSEFVSLLGASRGSPRVLRVPHVVPAHNVLALCLSRGPGGQTLNFSYDNRNSKVMLSEVGRVLRNMCSVVPGGVVVFLPSYNYETLCYTHLRDSGALTQIANHKRVFREPKSATEVDRVLMDFSSCASSGALMLSVVGGKLSEGLNFSDELGRCVIVVGMPYPNIKSAELQEKMSYLNKTTGPGAGNMHYDNLCMKAVNQCIGRAVRHREDYACVLLLDERYSRAATVAALPSFVRNSLAIDQNFGPAFGAIARFFSKHKKK